MHIKRQSKGKKRGFDWDFENETPFLQKQPINWSKTRIKLFNSAPSNLQETYQVGH